MKMFTLSVKNSLFVFLLVICSLKGLAQEQEKKSKKNTNRWYENMMGVTPSNANCQENTGSKDFRKFKEKTKEKVSDISMLKYAKAHTSNYCLSTRQIRAIMELFSLDKHRLEYALFAWPKSFDPDNKKEIYKGFLSRSSINKFNKAIQE